MVQKDKGWGRPSWIFAQHVIYPRKLQLLVLQPPGLAADQSPEPESKGWSGPPDGVGSVGKMPWMSMIYASLMAVLVINIPKKRTGSATSQNPADQLDLLVGWCSWTSPSPRGVERPAAPWRALQRYALASPARLPGMLEMGRLPPEFTAISNNSDWENE